MIPVFFVLIVVGGAVAGLASAINYFWQTGFRQALLQASFFVGIFLLFWASGLWEHASRRGWGTLFFIFALMLGGGWIAFRIGIRLWNKNRRRDGE